MCDLLTVNRIENLKVGMPLIRTNTNQEVIIEDINIIENKIKLSNNKNYVTLSTIKRWYKILDKIQCTSLCVTTPKQVFDMYMEEIKNREIAARKQKTKTIKNNCIPIREDLIRYCKQIDKLVERVASRYNSFYLDNRNIFEIMRGSKSFIVYFNEKVLDDKLKNLLTYNDKVRGNNYEIKVTSNNESNIVKNIIKSIVNK